MSVIDEVKQKLDIVEVVSQYTTLKKAGRNLSALCPFHTEKNPSFYVYPEQQSWHCFGACNTGGDVFSFIMRKENIDFGEALRMLADRVGVTIPTKFEPETAKDEKELLFKVNEAAALYFHNLLLNSPEAQKAREYLDRRGFSTETMSLFQLGFAANSWEALKQYLLEKEYSEDEILEAGLVIAADDGKTHDRFRNKLMIPIKDNRGRTTGFGARVLDDSLPKYVNSPQTPVFDKSGTLYAINLAAQSIRQQELAVIVEGYMDVITAHQNGFENVVASMGTAVTEKQVNTLKRLTRNLVLALDADTAGEEAMLRCVDYENTLDAEVKVAVLPEGKDPDDVIRGDPATWKNLLGDAIPVMDYSINLVSAGLDLTRAGDQSIFVDKIGPNLNKMKDPIRKAHYIQRLARLTDKGRSKQP
jgi:DNA primase